MDAIASADTASQRLEIALANVQPLRDLARNWDVDIASCLEDYLQEIVGHAALDHEQQEHASTSDATPNFAQAALLLQNSSGVYSRKVEYLYSLVYQALDTFVSSDQASKNKRQSGGDASIDEFFDFDPDMQFLLLDDVLPTDHTLAGTKINLNEEKQDTRASSSILSRPSTTRLSLGGMSVTRVDRNRGSIADARNLLGSLLSSQGDSGSSLRLLSGQCDVSDNGVLVMPGTAIGGGKAVTTNTSQDQNDDEPMMDNDGGFYDDNDDNSGGGGFEMADTHHDEEPTTSAASRHVSFQVPPPKKKKADPWTLLDPHDASQQKVRPLRIGTTYKLPEGLDQPPSASVTGASTRRRALTRSRGNFQTPLPVSIATETFKATVANRRQRRAGEDDDDDTAVAINRPAIPLKGLFFDEFAYIAKAQAKRKAAIRRERANILGPEQEADVPVEQDEPFYDNDYYDDGDSMGGGDDDVGNAGIASVDDAFGRASNSSNVDAIEFEALCRAHIKAFAKGAEKYAAETNLTKRVGDWQSRLAPILEEEEQRPEFNIHDYGDQVLSILSEKEEMTFAQVTQNCERYQVCRLFLATLSLRGDGNVAFTNADEPDSLSLKLLRSHVDRPMETYVAPSAAAAAAME